MSFWDGDCEKQQEANEKLCTEHQIRCGLEPHEPRVDCEEVLCHIGCPFNKGRSIMSIEKHEKDYKKGAYHEYSILELGMWVHLLSMRAKHRTDREKCRKDLYDADNYSTMIKQRLGEIEKEL